jgi:GH43 family beta-xylosidase
MSDPSARPTPRFPNPFILQRADPWIHRDERGVYTFTGSTPEYDRIELRRADSLLGLRTATPKVVWLKHAAGPMSWHVWAPEIHRIDGAWWIYFAAGRAEAIWDIRIWALSNRSADPLEGEWVERGQVRTNWESFALDATTFEHRGRRYLAWAQSKPDWGPGTSVFLAEMSDPLTIVGEQVAITRPLLPWEQLGHRVNEGPAVLKKHGRLFLSYSASATDHHYCMGLLSIDENADLLDTSAWAKSPTPVFGTCEATSQYGPGHNSFTTTEDGGTDLLVYHARNYRDVHPDPLRDPNRHARIKPIAWRPDGTPDFGRPEADD